jgi:uncharacterized membrane protein YphA (DoxX/SURF4 family)
MTPVLIADLLDARWLARVGAILLTCPFWLSGIAKLADLRGAREEARQLGLRPEWLVVAATVLVQVGGSALVISGAMAWLGAGALAVFTATATLIAHRFWRLADAAARLPARNIFMTNVGLIGGLIVIAILWSAGT